MRSIRISPPSTTSMKLHRAPDFWWRRHSLRGYALAPLGAIYGRVSARRMGKPGTAIDIPVLVSPAAHTARDVGDEALLLAQYATTVVSVDRPSGARLLSRLGVDVVV